MAKRWMLERVVYASSHPPRGERFISVEAGLNTPSGTPPTAAEYRHMAVMLREGAERCEEYATHLKARKGKR